MKVKRKTDPFAGLLECGEKKLFLSSCLDRSPVHKAVLIAKCQWYTSVSVEELEPIPQPWLQPLMENLEKTILVLDQQI